jgi:glutaminyl-peptide cyclotransferase
MLVWLISGLFIWGILFSQKTQHYSYEILNMYPHDKEAFTQGLFYEDGYLFESTGQFGTSSIRKVILETGEVIQKKMLPSDLFGEGITAYQDKIIQLTWISRIILVYNRENFKVLKLSKYSFPSEGWGLTSNGKNLIMSDGTQFLYFLDPENFTPVHRLEVKDGNRRIYKLNELEYINDKILANIWQSSSICIIDPNSGKVLGWIDLKNLVPGEYRFHADNVLNGIAYNSSTGTIYVTGKKWPYLYELKINGL